MARRILFPVLVALLVGCAPSTGPLPPAGSGPSGDARMGRVEAVRVRSPAREVVIRAAAPDLPFPDGAAIQAGPSRTPPAPEAVAGLAEVITGDAVVQPTPSESLPDGEEGVERTDAVISEIHIEATASEPLPDGAAGGLAALARTLGRVLGEGAESFGIVIEHVPSGQRLVHNPRRSFRAASVYKLAVAHEVLRRADEGALSLDDRLVVTVADALEEEPDGGLAPGDEVTVREALRSMMAVSSNAAAHALLRRIGYAALDEALAGQGLGATTVGSSADGYARTTPADMAHLLGLVARERTLSEASRGELRRLLALCEEPDGLVEALPDGVEVLSKAGTLDGASNVAGLVMTPGGPVIVAIFDEDMEPDEARATIGRVARAVVAFYGGPPDVP